MCCLMGPDILENPRRAAEPNPLEADFRVNTCKVMATDMLSADSFLPLPRAEAFFGL